jgi:hypothetical protein
MGGATLQREWDAALSYVQKQDTVEKIRATRRSSECHTICAAGFLA